MANSIHIEKEECSRVYKPEFKNTSEKETVEISRKELIETAQTLRGALRKIQIILDNSKA